MSEKERAKQTNRRVWGWGTFPKDRHHTRIRKNMHGNLDVGKNDELHTARVRRSSTMERRREGGWNRDRREEEGREGWKGQFFPQKEKQVESWTRGPTFAGRYCTRVPECKHRVAAGQLGYWFNGVSRKNVVYRRHWCDLQPPETQRETHRETQKKQEERRVSLESVHGVGPSRVTAEITNAGVFRYSSEDAAQCCRPSL